MQSDKLGGEAISHTDSAFARIAPRVHELDLARIDSVSALEPTAERRPSHADTALQLEALPEPAFRISASGQIEDLNALAEALIGARRAEIVGLAMTDLLELPAPVGGELATRFVPAASGARLHHRNGHAISIDALLCPHDHGSMLALVRPLRDVTSDDLREDDVAQIVHDLKSPLATIALETELLDLNEIERLDHGILGRAVKRITLNVGFLDRMISDLLDLCAMDTGRFALHRSATELRDLAERVTERVIATRDRARVSLRVPDPITLDVDALRIERVLANLLQNALKYAPGSSRIVIQLDVRPELVRISVTDAGPGVPVAERFAIFEKYRQAHTERVHEGYGLGLYVSKRIVEAHGGRIGVETAEGGGSCFYFELPAA